MRGALQFSGQVSWWYNYIYVGVVFALFAWFFVKNYISKRGGRKAKKPAAKVQ